MTVVPITADFKTNKAAREAWSAGKDFRICDLSSPDDGRAINNEDAQSAGIEREIMIRFAALRKICKAV